jgi:hypothetical protein
MERLVERLQGMAHGQHEVFDPCREAAQALSALQLRVETAERERDEALNDVPSLRKVLWTSEVQQARACLDALESYATNRGDDEGARSYVNAIRKVLAETLIRAAPNQSAEARATKAEAALEEAIVALEQAEEWFRERSTSVSNGRANVLRAVLTKLRSRT